MAAQLAGWYQAVRSLGIPVAKDQGNGKVAGVSYIASTIDPGNHRRRTSVGYLEDTLQPNLVVLTNSHVGSCTLPVFQLELTSPAGHSHQLVTGQSQRQRRR